MAKSQTRRNPAPVGKDELAKGAPTEGNNTPTPSRAQTPTPTVAPAPAQTPAPAPAQTPTPISAPIISSTDKLCQQLMKTYTATVKLLEQNQRAGPRERPFKARLSDLYYENSHLDCYRFCQQCENHFKTAGANGPNRISFATSFLCRAVVQQWHQHKRRSEAKHRMTWAEFKDFLQKNFEDDQVKESKSLFK